MAKLDECLLSASSYHKKTKRRTKLTAEQNFTPLMYHEFSYSLLIELKCNSFDTLTNSPVQMYDAEMLQSLTVPINNAIKCKIIQYFPIVCTSWMKLFMCCNVLLFHLFSVHNITRHKVARPLYVHCICNTMILNAILYDIIHFILCSGLRNEIKVSTALLWSFKAARLAQNLLVLLWCISVPFVLLSFIFC